jgi:hypothetical protein
VKLIVGFSKGATIAGSLIRLFTGQKISHCYIRLPFENDPELSVVFHAAGFNVHYMNFEYFKKFQKEIVSEWEIEMTPSEWARAKRVRFEHAGKPYGWIQIFGYVAVLINRRWKNPLSDKGRTHVCSELVAETLGLPKPEQWLPHEIEQEIIQHKLGRRL